MRAARQSFIAASRNNLAERRTILGVYSVCMECVCDCKGRGDIMTGDLSVCIPDGTRVAFRSAYAFVGAGERSRARTHRGRLDAIKQTG